jgi:hypothetical protein
MKFLITCLAICAAVLAGCSKPAATPTAAPSNAMNHPMKMDDVASAMSAAPKSVSKDATIQTMDSKGGMKTLRKGTNGWMCMPDTPSTPGPDPMCVDKNGAAFVMALASHTDPPKGQVGFGYMLAGGSDPDNNDPYATKPPKGGSWVNVGPHVMVFNSNDLAGYPTTPDNPKAPFVMWPNTPYAHLMIPVK